MMVDPADDFDVPTYYDPPAAFVSRPAPYFQGKGTVLLPHSILHVGTQHSTTAVVDGEIKDISLDDYRGKFVILFFYPKDWYARAAKPAAMCVSIAPIDQDVCVPH